MQGDLDVDRLIAVLQTVDGVGNSSASFVVSRHLGPACLAGCSQRGQPSRCRGAASISYAFPFLQVGTLPPKALPPTARGSSCASAPSALSEFLSSSVFLLLEFFCLCLNPVFDYRCRASARNGGFRIGSSLPDGALACCTYRLVRFDSVDRQSVLSPLCRITAAQKEPYARARDGHSQASASG